MPRLADRSLARVKQTTELSASWEAYVPGSLIVNESLRRHAKPAACTMYDVAHVCFVNGVFQVEMQAFMDAAYRATEGTASPFSYSLCYQYMESWRWPKHVGQAAARSVFTEAMVARKSFPSAASASLSFFRSSDT